MDMESIAESVNDFAGKKKEQPIKFNIGRTVSVGLAFLAISMFWQIYDSLMPLFLKDFDFDKTIIGIIMALDNILAIVLLPLMGTLSDKFPTRLRAKFGRRIPFIVAGSVLSAVMFLLVNYAHNKHMLGVLMASTALLLVFMCLYRTPAVALMPDVTPKQVRSQGNAVINIMGLIGGVISLLLMKVLLKTETVAYSTEKVIIGDNWLLIGIICSLMVACAMVMILIVKENKLVENKLKTLRIAGIDDDEEAIKSSPKITVKQALNDLSKFQILSLFFILLSVFLWYMAYNAVITWFSSYSYEALGIDFTTPLLLANVAAAAMFVPSVIIGKKIGRKNTILLGVIMLLLAFFVAMFLMTSKNNLMILYGIYPVLFLVGGGWATINVHSFVMSVEFATEQTTGKFTGFYYTFAMAAQILTPILSGLFIDKLGYVALMPYAFIFTVFAFVSMLFVRHGNAKDKPVKRGNKQQ